MIYFLSWLAGSFITAYLLGRCGKLSEKGDLIVIPASVFWPFTLIVLTVVLLYETGLRKS